MLRLSKLTDYAVVVLVRLSVTDAVQTSTGIAGATGIPEPTVAKVLKALAGRGWWRHSAAPTEAIVLPVRSRRSPSPMSSPRSMAQSR